MNKITGRRIAAVVPMHTFGVPCRIEEIAKICNEFHVPLVEDSAESLGSFYAEKHTGTFGAFGAFSFNGNKTITTGGGGMLVTNDPELAKKAKHITTTAKQQHPYEFFHDEIGYNYRLPNINAALGCAQMETLARILQDKKCIADAYKMFFLDSGMNFLNGLECSTPNYWLNALVLPSLEEREVFLRELNEAGIMCRPIWRLMSELPMFSAELAIDLVNSKWLQDRVVNLPSSARISC